MSFNKAIIIAAPSGSGKTTIVKYLLRMIPQLEFSVSATSRKKRENEIDKIDYYFLAREDFIEKVNNQEFVEWEEVYSGSLYGTLKSEVNRIWSEGKCIIFDVDVQGAIRLKDYFKDQGLSMFIRVKNIHELEDRLLRRGTESEMTLRKRLDKVKYEMKFETEFDFVIINDVLKKAQKEAEQIIRTFLNI